MNGPPIPDTRLHDLVATVAPLITLRISLNDSGEITAAEPLYADNATADQRAAGDAIIADYLGDATKLERAKTAAGTVINAATAAKIAEGFTHNGQVFSLSLASQANWQARGQALMLNLITFPYVVRLLNDDSYEIATAAEMQAIMVTAYTTVKTHTDAGLAKWLLVKNATSIAEINSILAGI